MRTAVLTAAALLALPLAGCGSEESLPVIESPPASTAPADPEEASVREDVQAYAVQLEQVFFSSGYPDGLAGALVVAAKLDLKLAPGNTIATYTYDQDAAEFQLCVENTSGAWAVYDTQPMSVLESGAKGGCR